MIRVSCEMSNGYSGSYDGGCIFLFENERKLTLPASERSPPICACCKGVSVEVDLCSLLPRLHAHDQSPSLQSLLCIRVTSSSHEWSCRLWTRQRGLRRAASDETPRFHNLVSELKACGRVRTRKGGREEPGENVWWTSDKRYTTQDDHWTSRRRANSKQAQSKRQIDEDRTNKSRAMKTEQKKFAGRSR